MSNPDKTPKPKRVKVLRQQLIVTFDTVLDVEFGAMLVKAVKTAIRDAAAEHNCMPTIDEKPFKTPTVEVE